MTINLPYVDRIWRATGEVPIAERLAPEEAFARLDPLFRTPGTSYAVSGDTLTYSKRNPAAQDKLATFTSGTIRVERQHDGASRLFFNVSSTALLLCFLAPLLFLGFAQAMVMVNAWEKSAVTAAQTSEKETEEAKPKPELHPLDKLLGAPEPEDPSEKKDEEKDEEKLNPTAAYVLAGLFFAIYLVGRVLEPWLLKRTLRAALAARPDESPAHDGTPGAAAQGPQAGTC